MTRQAFSRAGGKAVLIAAALVAGVVTIGSARPAVAQAADPTLDNAAKQYFPSDATGAPTKRIVRLTRDQIDATVSGLLPDYVPQPVKTVMARDPLQTNYEYAEMLSFNSANVGALTKWIGDIAARVRQNPKGVVDCAAEKDSEDCLKDKARAFVTRAFRGDADDRQVDRFVNFYAKGVQTVGVNEATAELVEVVLNSPAFLFRTEFGSTRSKLDPTQHLNALTYILTDAPPATLAKASPDKIRPPQAGQTAATVNVILASPEAREKLVRFFKAWLEIKEPGEFTISEMVFPEFTPELAKAMVDEADQFLRARLSKPKPSLKDITQATDVAVPKGMEAIYKSSSAASTGSKTAKLDPAKRLGIFSLPAVLASHSGPTDTRPIKRGVFWVRKVMCMQMDPTPPNVTDKLPDIPNATERQRIEQATSTGSCPDCHKLINPFGFFQESYDALGRFRTVENGKPVDASISINFLDEEPVKTVGAVDALKTFTNSMAFKQCFVRQLFRFYMARNEEPSDDPLLRQMFLQFAKNDDQDIIQVIQTMASSDRISRRQ